MSVGPSDDLLRVEDGFDEEIDDDEFDEDDEDLDEDDEEEEDDEDTETWQVGGATWH